MATKDTVVQELVVNTLTQAQFDAAKEAGTLSPYELYGTPDTSVRLPVLTPMWFDHLANDVSWLRADTFSWYSGDVYKAAYEHLADDYESIEKDILYAWNWTMGDEIVYTKTSNPSVGDVLYNSNGDVLSYSIVEMNDGTMYINESSAGGRATRQMSSDIDLTIKTDTIGDITISYYLAEDGHKICAPDQESKITALYEKTGVADYYLLDTTNKQFKLPRKQKRRLIQAVKNTDGTWYNLYSDGWVEQGGNIPLNTSSVSLPIEMAQENYLCVIMYRNTTSTNSMQFVSAYTNSQTTTGFTCVSSSSMHKSWRVAGYAAESAYASAGMQLEYYYVGNFEQDSVEQTAGINAEMFNAKADVNLMNTASNVDIVIESQLPTADNGYTWYRKYKSGWVEQGGVAPYQTNTGTVSFAITMTDSEYQILANVKRTSITGSNAVFSLLTNNLTTTGFDYKKTFNNGSATGTAGEAFYWQVAGYVA